MVKLSSILRKKAAFLVGKSLPFAALLLAERRLPLRQQTQSQSRRLGRNIFIAMTAGATVVICENPMVAPLAKRVKSQRLGLLGSLSLPNWLETAAAVVLMDYTLFLWHYLNHRTPLLWRFHLPHHVDLDMDASTAFRFHFGELALSTLWRAAQIRLIGTSLGALSLWQQLTSLSILFHHANLRLPERLDAALSLLIVTPRMHDVHHSRRHEERNSNWSSGLSIWDRLHGTFRSPRALLSQGVGVPPFDQPNQVTIGKVLTLPFTEARSGRDAAHMPASLKVARCRS